MENIQPEPLQVTYLKKYLTLKTRCEEVQLANEKLLNRIYNVKKILKRYKKERSCLMEKLDDFGDDYQDELVPSMWEEGAQEDDEEEEDPEPDLIAPALVIKEEKIEPGHPQLLGMDQAAAPLVESKRQKKGSRAYSPYMVFCSHRRATVQQKHLEESGEEASRAELNKLLNFQWAKLSLEEKQVYQSLSNQKNLKLKSSAPSPSPIKQEVMDTKDTVSPGNSDFQ